MYAIIDGAAVADRGALHALLAQQLALPEWYGNNLDALYDCLTERREDTDLYLVGMDALQQTLGGYADAFWTVLTEAAEENPHIRLHWEDFEISAE